MFLSTLDKYYIIDGDLFFFFQRDLKSTRQMDLLREATNKRKFDDNVISLIPILCKVLNAFFPFFVFQNKSTSES